MTPQTLQDILKQVGLINHLLVHKKNISEKVKGFSKDAVSIQVIYGDNDTEQAANISVQLSDNIIQPGKLFSEYMKQLDQHITTQKEVLTSCGYTGKQIERAVEISYTLDMLNRLPDQINNVIIFPYDIYMKNRTDFFPPSSIPGKKEQNNSPSPHRNHDNACTEKLLKLVSSEYNRLSKELEDMQPENK